MNQAHTATASPPARLVAGLDPELPVKALSAPVRIRAALIGLGLGALALLAATALALLIVAGPFHTSPGSIG